MSDHNHTHGPTGSNGHDDHHQHYILPDSLAVKVGVSLFILTFITVGVAKIDLGPLNFVVALLVACVKASLVCLWFMGLLKDKRENAVIFGTSFVFLAIFIVLTSTDLFFRGDVYVKGSILPQTAQAASKFKKPWISSPELLAAGKTVYEAQCVTCHGEKGEGNGVAAAALNPKPRNFTQNENWKNGRRVTMIFKTLSNGLGGMPSFGTLSADDRWALTHYVLSLGPQPAPQDTAEDFAAIKIDPSKEDGGQGGAPSKSIPVDFAIERLAEPKS